jgi:hypothetical protein
MVFLLSLIKMVDAPPTQANFVSLKSNFLPAKFPHGTNPVLKRLSPPCGKSPTDFHNSRGLGRQIFGP